MTVKAPRKSRQTSPERATETSPVARRGKLRVLFVCHNHPSLYPGGAEGYALQVYRQMRDAGDVEPFFLARYGTTVARKAQPHPGTPFSVIGEDDHQYLLHTETNDFDPFLLTLRSKAVLTTHYRDFLRTIRPDVVHFQHTHFLGVDMIRETRNTLPSVPIVYTLHEYHSICHRDGVMVRTIDDEPCMESSPRRCNECFPAIAPQEFFMRRRFLQSHLHEVDQFLAPSQFLMDRYVDWGISQERIRYHDHGLVRWPPKAESAQRNTRDRFAFFGQINRYKGIDVLLKAMKHLIESSTPTDTQSQQKAHLWVHGANLELQGTEFQREVKELVEETSGHVTWAGRYEESDVPRLMSEIDWVMVPSRWWENSPRVIQEAFQYGRPVICSGFGALAEKVTNEVNGLHFRPGDPTSLAGAMRRAATTPGLWDRLRQGIPTMRSIDDDVRSLVGLYENLLEGRRKNGRSR
ncbi:MAG: glycosyltransferase family 4 protein [Gemmatimonadota bacterium]